MTEYFMRMHRELRMKKVFQDTISSSYFISIPTNNKFAKSLRYIHDNKSWERLYVLLYIIVPCLRVILLTDINHAVIQNVYYYSIMTK